MLKTKEGILVWCIAVIMATSFIGAHLGYQVEGINMGISTEDPSIFGALAWAWESMQFYFNLMFYKIDNMPYVVSVLYNFITLVGIADLIIIIRG